MNLKNNFIYKGLKSCYIGLIHFVCDSKRKPLIAPLEEGLKRLSFAANGGGNSNSIKDLSLISSNCFTGRIMQDIGMQYITPTLGLYFMYPDYIEFLSNLEYYLKEAKIEFVEHSKYAIGDERLGATGIRSVCSEGKSRFISFIITRKKRRPRNGTGAQKE